MTRRLNPSILGGLLVLLIATLIQEAVISQTSIQNVRPDLVLLVVLDWGLLRGVEEGMVCGFVGGLFVDMFSGLPFGTTSAAYVVIAGLVSLGEAALMRAHLLLPVVTAFVSTFLYYLVALVVVASADHHLLLNWALVETVTGVAIFNAIVNPFVYWAMQSLEFRIRPVARTTL